MSEKSRVRFGVTVGRGTALGVVEQARLAASSGFDSIWMMDHLNGFPIEKGAIEPFTTLGAITRDCRNVLLGCAATDPFRRHPAILAQSLGTLAALTQGPVALVMGAGEAMNLESFGFVAQKPLARIRESFAIIRQLLESSANATVQYSGEFFRIDSAFLQFSEALSPALLYIASNGPAGIKAAGQYADGWMSLLLTPELVTNEYAELARGAAAAHRDATEIDIAHHIDIALAANSGEAIDLVRDSASKLLLGFPAQSSRIGFQAINDFDWRHLLVSQARQNELTSAMASVPQDVIRKASIVGTEDDCIRQLDAYVEAGVTHFIFRCANPLDEIGAFIRRSLRPRY